MSDADRNEGAGETLTGDRPREGRLAKSWRRIVEGFAAAGTILIGVLMLIVCADIVARNSAGASLPLVSEAGALLVVLLVALQLASTVRSRRLARTEIFILPFSERFPRVGAVVTAIFDLVGAAILGLVAWASIRILEKDLASSEFIGIVGMGTLPTWPFRLLILLGFAVAAVEFLVRFLEEIRRAAGERT